MKNKEIKTVVPKLRFPEFQGMEEWDVKPLAKIAYVVAGQSPQGSNYNDVGVGIPFYQGKTDFGEIFLNFPTKWTTKVTKTANEGDILMSVRAPVGALNISTNEICIGRGLAAIQPYQNKWFLYYFLSSIQNSLIGNGGSVFDSINKDQIKKIRILIPKNPKEQQKIADCLSSIDDLITSTVKKIEALKAHKKGLMQQLFPAEGKKIPAIRLPEFQNAGEWKPVQLGQCLLKSPEYGINASAVPYSDKLPVYLRITDISDDGIISEQKVSVARKVTENNYLEEGDIVLARTGASVGKSYKYRKKDGRLVFAGFLIRIQPDTQLLNSEFIYQFFHTAQYWKWINLTSARSGQPGINGNEYSAMPLLIPNDIEEQQKIAGCLSSLDDFITALSQKLKVLKNHKKGLMQQLFPDMNE